MSEALTTTDPRRLALTRPAEKPGVPSPLPGAPAAAQPPAPGTTWDPHDRVPHADAEAEC